MYRTKTCGELRKEHNGQAVTLAGWVDSVRDHSGVLFINLRDRFGLTQIVFLQQNNNSLAETVRTLHPEDVIQVIGTVGLRPEGIVNKKIPTGEIEVAAAQLSVLNRTAAVPFLPGAPEIPAEETRLKYRYLDLRRPVMQKTLMLRHRITKVMRDYFDELGFVEIETPMLGKSTPEGARDYLVPSRVAQGQFYALPQSPQLYKQILMIAGYDRYFQIARCFRDEDLRADRQPEFTQMDVEMAFADMEDIIGVISTLIARLMKNILGRELTLPIPKMSYDDAMERFGHDAPDLRFAMELIDLTDIAAKADFRVFRSVADSGGRVRAINAKGAAEKYSRKDIDGLNAWVIDQFGAKGVAWLKVDNEGKLAGPIAKNFTEEQLQKIAARLNAQANDFMLFSADTFAVTCKVLNGLRRRLAAELNLINAKEMNFCWIMHFPMFGRDEEEGRWVAMHHPFTAPLESDLPYLDTKTDADAPAKIRAQAYDLVLNGFEVGGGTIRIHDSKVQSQVFDLLGLPQQTAAEQFGFLLDALQFGAPPHGGIALGLDRLVMLFGGLDNIRDCIAFPKTTKAADLMTGAPSTVADKQLTELAISVKKPAPVGFLE
ncbi:MAG: aspartate--tRNA ligase [Planctomycetaceae bacterium]|jgi:aspartyl-tRNA synthetase|nr:aspartate--tRNA ligase [Planctomycetaceae bacterium]